jgi:hypothetical protein
MPEIDRNLLGSVEENASLDVSGNFVSSSIAGFLRHAAHGRGRLPKWKKFTHMCGKQLAEILSIAREHSTLVPHHRERLSNRLALMC